MKRGKERSFGILLTLIFLLATPIFSWGKDKLIIKDEGGAVTFKVEDTGAVMTTSSYAGQGEYPGFWLDETGSGNKGVYFVLDGKWMQFQRRAQDFGAYEASPIFINIGAPHKTFVIADTGYVGFGVWGPTYPLQMASGACCTAGGVWVNASSREYKTDIKKLTSEKALETLTQLDPVEFAYKTDRDEKHIGFIAEDAPDLVATKDRKGMSPMDVVAVLTKVVQEQQKILQNQQATIAELSRRLSVAEKGIKAD